MSKVECSWCGIELDEGGIPHKGLVFCSKECRDEWDEDTLTGDAINLDDLDDLKDDELDDDELDKDLGLDDDLVLDEGDF